MDALPSAQAETTASVGGAKGTFKRDALRDIERAMQAKWTETRLFEQDAPSRPRQLDDEKFMATFPYPYMNGKLHLGHAFTLSKVDFAVAYERQKGKRVLFPFAFHCTGMPIKVAADGIAREIELYGNPPRFPDQTVSSGVEKKSKVASKEGSVAYKWNILAAMGIPEDEIARFADPMHWCRYFPPVARADISSFGAQVDWRRSFITTDANPFYDAFVRWQFNRLRSLDLIRFGKRHTIYSPRDGQACMDHDRASGEGVDAEEFTGIKLQVVRERVLEGDFKREILSHIPPSASVFFLAATLRPETMYGQTNCWVGPDLEYGCYRVSEDDYFVCTLRAARSLSFQGFSRTIGQVESVGGAFFGHALIGLPLRAPLSCYPIVYVLPMMNVSAVKGTGIVTSVPSNSPDDYAALRDLREKPALRSKYGILDEHVLPHVASPIIDTPSLGNLPAERIVQELGIRSQNDRDLLEQAKEQCYKEDFYQGTMLVGPHAGKPVSQAKAMIRDELMQAGYAITLYCPKSIIMSRSGEECVVALIDQWYLAYGESAWRSRAELCLSRMNCYSQDVRNAFEQSLEWMHQWACSRSFGLGTRMPWDPDYLIESLSDSTVYMAYYTVSHILHGGSLDGTTRPLGIEPAQMSDAVWDYIFGHSDAKPAGCTISQATLDLMRREFAYWYPLDLRVSGKDLICNHLTMFIYNHVALFPEHLWPRSVRANGHLLLNSQKMSKSTGNFMTLNDAIAKYGADATRVALADSGDTVEDANFLDDIANNAILRLFSLKELAEAIIAATGDVMNGRPASSSFTFRPGHQPACFADRVFAAELDRTVMVTRQFYEQAMYREVIKHALYELQNARDRYRDMTVVHCTFPNSWFGMQHSLMMRYLEIQARLLAPIIPHLSDYFWTVLLNRTDSVLTCGPLKADSYDDTVLQTNAFVASCAHDFRIQMQRSKEPVNAGTVYIASDYPAWQRKIHDLAKVSYLEDKEYVMAVNKHVLPLCTTKLSKKQCIPYAMEHRKQTHTSTKPTAAQFSEEEVLKECVDYLGASLRIAISIEVVDVDAPWPHDGVAPPIPSNPTVKFIWDEKIATKYGRVIDLVDGINTVDDVVVKKMANVALKQD